MGQAESYASSTNMQMMDSYAYAPVAFDHRYGPNQLKSFKPEVQGTFHKSSYAGVWSMDYPLGVGPGSRIGQCTVYDASRNRMIIAYGCDQNGQCLNDVWALELDSMRWVMILSRALSPRQFCSAVLVGRKMFIFGGVFKHQFYADLHTIDIDTGEVQILNNVRGQHPGPRTSPCLFFHQNSIFLWGGYDGSTKSGIHRFNFETFEWTRSDKTQTGRAAAAYCEHKGRFFIFGSSKGHGLLEFHPDTGDFETIECTGTEPPHQLNRASLISVDEYLFLIGGESDSPYMYIYAFDVEKKWWFAFHIKPDMQSISLSDGHISSNGLFMLPREFSSSVVYNPNSREIISILGSKMINPVPYYKVQIGTALSTLHLRNDMTWAFKQGIY